MHFLVMDPSGQYETGEVVTWSNKLVLRNRLTEQDGKRTVELLAAPTGEIRYTRDGSEPREGILYDGPVDIGDGEVLLRAFAEASGLETKVEFRFPARGTKGVQIDDVKPGERSVTFEGVVLMVGQGNQVVGLNVGKVPVQAAFLESLLKSVLDLEKFTPDTPITMSFRRAHFASGYDLKQFADKLGLELQTGDVEQ
jgi:hypothetical protein